MTSAAAPAPPIAAPMSPGTYLRKRREAAGISLDLAALAFVPWPDPALPAGQRLLIADVGQVLALENGITVRGHAQLLALVRACSNHIAQIEADTRIVDRTITAMLARLIPLDIQIYDALVGLLLGVDVPVPQICRECGCSLYAPCFEPIENGSIPCAWSATDPNLCTACERKAAAAQPEHADAS